MLDKIGNKIEQANNRDLAIIALLLAVAILLLGWAIYHRMGSTVELFEDLSFRITGCLPFGICK